MIRMLHHSPIRSKLRAAGHCMFPKLLRRIRLSSCKLLAAIADAMTPQAGGTVCGQISKATEPLRSKALMSCNGPCYVGLAGCNPSPLHPRSIGVERFASHHAGICLCGLFERKHGCERCSF